MQRSHFLVLGIAFLTMIGLYLMPRSVVNTKERTMTNTEKTSESDVQGMHNEAQEMHAQALTSEQIEAIAENRTTFLEATNEIEKGQAYQEFAQQLREVAQFDSLVFFAQQFYEQFPSDKTLEIVGDAHYEAFAFAMNTSKKAELAQKAREFYAKIQHPSPEIKVKIGVTYVTTTAPMQGITMIRKVLEENPTNQFALFHLGNLSMQSGQFDKAIERFELLISLNPNDLEAQLRLAECYLQLQQPEKALPRLEFVLENTDDEIRKDAIKKLLNELKK